jgi:glucokinase
MGFADALLINDFACLCFAIPALSADDVHVLGPDLPVIHDQPIAILGAGTGFGAACLARFRGRTAPLSTEGGHAGFAPGNEAEHAVLERLMQRFGRVSIERVLSGPGLQNLYQALCEIGGEASAVLEPADIVARREQDPVCREAVDMFCGIYGAVAGDFALSYGARGGVYLAGGIAQKIEPILHASQFRARFEDKGRMSHFVQPIATRLIVSEDTAHFGAAGALLAFRAAP